MDSLGARYAIALQIHGLDACDVEAVAFVRGGVLCDSAASKRERQNRVCTDLADSGNDSFTFHQPFRWQRFLTLNPDQPEIRDGNDMMTLGEAARQCGISKGTISKAIKTGKLSATRREDNSWAIDNSEFARYLEANQHRFRSDTVETDQPVTPAATDALVAELRAVISDLRSDRDHWREQAQRLALPAPKPDEQPQKPASLWRWLRSTG